MRWRRGFVRRDHLRRLWTPGVRLPCPTARTCTSSISRGHRVQEQDPADLGAQPARTPTPSQRSSQRLAESAARKTVRIAPATAWIEEGLLISLPPSPDGFRPNNELSASWEPRRNPNTSRTDAVLRRAVPAPLPNDEEIRNDIQMSANHLPRPNEHVSSNDGPRLGRDRRRQCGKRTPQWFYVPRERR